MNIKKTWQLYWQFFNIALLIQKNPGMPVYTQEQKIYDLVKKKYPGVKITLVKKK